MEALLNLESYKAIEGVIDGATLSDFQSVDVLKMLWYKKGICMYDTGLGKTVVSSAVIKMLIREVPSRRFIMFVEKSQLIQTPDDVRRWAGVSVGTVTGEQKEIDKVLFRKDFLKHQVLMLTHDTLNNPSVMSLLLEHKDAYYGVIIDEAHKLNNYDGSSSAFMLRGLLRNFDFRIALTATPVTSDLSQVIKLAHMIDWERFRDVNHWRRQVENGFPIVEEYPDFFFNRTRTADLGVTGNYRTHIEFIKPHEYQVGKTGMGLTRITKGPGAYNQADKLIKIIEGHKPLRGLVYINMHAVRNFVMPLLAQAGIKAATINGTTKMADRKQIQQDFADGKYDVVITSVTTALNLNCDYIVFYEFCTDIKQMMGRAHRGLNPKTLDLHFIFTQETGEVEYFIKYIYERSLAIQHVLQKDYSELINAGHQLSSMM